MKVGSIVLATDQGLGYLAKEFFDRGVITNVLIKEHSSRYNHKDWYPDSAVARSIDELVTSCDALLFFEEVFHWQIIPLARAAGVRTVLMPMYECTRNPLPYVPDVIIAPSALDLKYYPQAIHIPVPVSVPWKKRSKARVFVHNAGNGGIGGRNGTRELLQAMEYVKSPIELIVRSQVKLDMQVNRGNGYRPENDPRIRMHVGTISHGSLWQEGDVFVFPEKFNGLSLPLQEAYASGMLVMAGARFPMTQWLPREPLIPVAEYKRERIAVDFPSAIYRPKDIAATIDAWYDRDIEAFSLAGKRWAQENSWTKLTPRYLEALSTTTVPGAGSSNSH